LLIVVAGRRTDFVVWRHIASDMQNGSQISHEGWRLGNKLPASDPRSDGAYGEDLHPSFDQWVFAMTDVATFPMAKRIC